MRSKNTDSYESESRSFQYTMMAVIGVLIVVGIIAYAMRGMWEGNGLREDSMKLNPLSETGQKEEPLDVSASQSVPSVDSRDSKSEGPKKEKQEKESGFGFEAPLKGRVQKEFSPEVPLYSKTLEQYQVHWGVDLEAASDTQVKAIASGTVTAVYEDDQMGITIEISHSGGFVSKYSNLSTMEMVEENDVVEKGQVISGVGNTALFESLDPEHLHVELWKDGQAVNPAKYW